MLQSRSCACETERSGRIAKLLRVVAHGGRGTDHVNFVLRADHVRWRMRRLAYPFMAQLHTCGCTRNECRHLAATLLFLRNIAVVVVASRRHGL